MRTTTSVLALCIALTLGCAAGESGRSASAGTEGQAVAQTAGREGMTVELQSIVKETLADAAKRTERDVSTLKVLSAEAVTWLDGGLGCPEPGVMYTMALVPGYRIRIQAGAEVLDYHATRRGYWVLCPPGRAGSPAPPGSM